MLLLKRFFSGKIEMGKEIFYLSCDQSHIDKFSITRKSVHFLINILQGTLIKNNCKSK